MPIISSPVPAPGTSGSAGVTPSSIVGITDDLVDQLNRRNILYEVKFFIKDDNGKWVDFSDKAEATGKNALVSHPSITHSMEGRFGVFHTSDITIQVSNDDGFWDDSASRFEELLTTDGATAAFSYSSGGQSCALYRHEAKLEAWIKLDSGPNPSGIVSTEIVPLGVFLVEDVSTDSNSGTADIKLTGKQKPLLETDAERVKNGLGWYEYRPTRILARELVRRYYIDYSNGEIPADYKFPGLIEVRVPPDVAGVLEVPVRTFGWYGRPIDNQLITGTRKWYDEPKETRALAFGALTNYAARLWLGCDNELWSFDSATEEYTKHTVTFTGSVTLKIQHLFIYEGWLYIIVHDDENCNPAYDPGLITNRRHRETQEFQVARYDGVTFQSSGNLEWFFSGRWSYRGGLKTRIQDNSGGYSYAIGQMTFNAFDDAAGGENLSLPFDQNVIAIPQVEVSGGINYGAFARELFQVPKQEDGSSRLLATLEEDVTPEVSVSSYVGARVGEGAYVCMTGSLLASEVIDIQTNATIPSVGINTPRLTAYAITAEGSSTRLGYLASTAFSWGSFSRFEKSPVLGRIAIALENGYIHVTQGTTLISVVTNTGTASGYFNSTGDFSIGAGHTRRMIYPAADNYMFGDPASGDSNDLVAYDWRRLTNDYASVPPRHLGTLDLRFTYGQKGIYAIIPTYGATGGCFFTDIHTSGSGSSMLMKMTDITEQGGGVTPQHPKYRWRLANIATGINTIPGFWSDVDDEGLRAGFREGTQEARAGLEPTCARWSSANSTVYVGCIAWQDYDDEYSPSWIMAVKDDGSAYASATLNGAVSAGDITFSVNNATFESHTKIGTIVYFSPTNDEAIQVQATSGTGPTFTITTNRPMHSHSNGAAVAIYTRPVWASHPLTGASHTTTNPYVILDLEMYSNGTDILVLYCNRTKIGTGSYEYFVGKLTIGTNVITQLIALGGCPRGLTKNTGEGVSGIFYFVEAGPNKLWSVDDSDDSFMVHDYGHSAVDDEAGLCSHDLAFDNTKRTGDTNTKIVYGVSRPTICEASDLPNEPYGKFILWKYDTYITDRIPLADFTGMKVWDALSNIARAFDMVMGFSANGSYFLKPRTTPTSLVTLADSLFKTDIVSLNKSLGYSEIFNYAAFTPSRVVVEEPKLNASYIARDDNQPTLGLGDFMLQIRGNHKRSVRLQCITGGNVPPYHSDAPIRFRWLTFDAEIEVRLAGDITAGQTTGIPLTSTFGGNNNDAGVNDGDYFKIASKLVDGAFITKRITAVNETNNQISIESALGEAFLLGDTVLIVQGNSVDTASGRSIWSDEGLTTVNGAITNDTIVTVRDTRNLKKGMFLNFITTNGVLDDYGIVISVDTANSQVTLNRNVTLYNNSKVCAYLAFSTTGVAYEIGNTGVSIGIIYAAPPGATTEQRPLFMAGDMITIEIPGAKLEQDNQSKQEAYHLISINKWGKKEYKWNDKNPFLHYRLAQARTRQAVIDYKDPHYLLEIESRWLPFISFLDTNGELLGLAVQNYKLFPNAPNYTVSGLIREISHGPAMTRLTVRCDSAY